MGRFPPSKRHLYVIHDSKRQARTIRRWRMLLGISKTKMIIYAMLGGFLILAGVASSLQPEINQFLNDFLRGPASQARW